MNHGQRRQDPKNVGQKLKAERAAQGIPELPENEAYDAVRAQFAATRKKRQAMAAQKRKHDAALRARGIDPERHVAAELHALDEEASAKLGVPSLRQQLAK